jgi:two-component system response regulator LytT
LNLARQLATLGETPAIVFATAYDEYALEAFELDAVDYILKPFDEERIQKTLEKIKKMKNIGNKNILSESSLKHNSNGKIAVLADERIILLTVADILYLEASEGKCHIITNNQAYKVADALVVLEKKLNKAKFIRVHRSFIVNLDHIVEIEPWFNSTYNLQMMDGSKVPVSRTYVKELKQLLGF